MTDGYEAHVRDAFELMSLEIFLTRGRREQIRKLNRHRAEFVPVDPLVATPGLILPWDFAEPLRNALDVALGRPHDDYRSRYEEARDALEFERRRVDQFILSGD